jgi:hypothetical protein
MLFSFGVLLILCGLGIMALGLFLFYAWLPILYGLFGLEIGFLLGQWLSGELGPLTYIFGIVGAGSVRRDLFTRAISTCSRRFPGWRTDRTFPDLFAWLGSTDRWHRRHGIGASRWTCRRIDCTAGI